MTSRNSETVTKKRSKGGVVSNKSDAGAHKRISRPRRTTKLKATPDSTLKDPSAPTPLSPQQRHHMIDEAAYLLAERRGFTPGSETEDWLAAEAAIDAEIH